MELIYRQSGIHALVWQQATDDSDKKTTQALALGGFGDHGDRAQKLRIMPITNEMISINIPSDKLNYTVPVAKA